MKRKIILGGLFLSIIAMTAAMSVALASPVEASAESESTPTDITASSAWHDLCLLYNNGDFTTYSPFSDTRNDKRRLDYFDLICVRPYEDDLYLYFFFDNSNKEGYTFDTKSQYWANIHAERKSGYSTTDTFPLQLVGNPYRNGYQYLIKFRANDVFDDYEIGEEMAFVTLGFGKYKNAEIDPDWAFTLNKREVFSYQDAQFDITASIWGEECNVVTVTKAMSKPMVVDLEYQDYTDWWSALVRKPDKEGRDAELFGYFFDLDKSLDHITHLDLYYSMIEYQKEGLYSNRMITYGMYPTDNYNIYNIPVDTVFEGSTEYTSQYKRMDIYDDESWDITETRKSGWTGFFGLDFDTSYTTHVKKIIDIKRKLQADVQDEDARNWISTNAVKEDGSQYQYAVFFDCTMRYWGEKTRVETKNNWASFIEQTYAKYTAHEAHGILTLHMTEAKQDGTKVNWNVFAQPVDSQPGSYKAKHQFTMNELFVAFTKRNNGLLKNFILGAYYAICALAMMGIFSLLLSSGKPEARIRIEDIKGTKGRRRGK